MAPLFRGLKASLINAILRGGALVGRFAIALYLIRFMSLSDAGHFGLITGVAGFLPPVIGLGFNYFVSREIVGTSPVDAGARIRDRLCVSGLGVALSLLAYLGLVAAGTVPLTAAALWAAPVVMLEIFAYDLHFSLISLKRPGLANFGLFVRSSLWIAPFIALSFFQPQYRTLTCLLQFWLAGLVLNAAILTGLFRRAPWRQVLSRPVDIGWLVSRARRGWLIYLSDIGLAGYSYIDRFILASLLGLAATGIYTFFWTMGNATYVLVTAATVQVALPELIEGHQAGEAVWQSRFNALLGKSGLGGLAAAVMAFGAVTLVVPRLGKPELRDHAVFFIVILVANVIKTASESLQYGLYSLGRDRDLAAINIAGIFATLILSFVGLKLFGLWGAVWALLITTVLIAGMRLVCVLRGTGRIVVPAGGL